MELHDGMEQNLIQLINLGGFLGMLVYLAYNVFLRGEKQAVHQENVTPLWASDLVEHFNHETTALLREIRDEVKKTNVTLETWEKYGVPGKQK